VLENANTTGVEGVVVFNGAANTFVVVDSLPTLVTKLTIDGTGAGVVIDASAVPIGLTVGSRATGSTIRGITIRGASDTGIVLDGVTAARIQGCVIQACANGLRGSGNLAGTVLVGTTFSANRNFGISLSAARGLLVDGVTVTGVNTSSSMGLFASGDLAGTRIVRSRFSGGLRGALLQNARNAVFGEVGRGNVLADNRSAPGTAFAGTGMRVEGDLTGTVVEANTFKGNNYGFAFVGGRNIVVRRNTFTKNSLAAIFVEGDNAGSRQTDNVFGTGGNANKTRFVRITGSRGI
jgi:parallel beta-helix repeat protein